MKSLEYTLPIVENYRIVNDRYLIGYDQREDVLVIVDMINPLEPVEIVRWHWGDQADFCRIRYDEEYVYRHCGRESKTLSVIDISDMFQPILLFEGQSIGMFDYTFDDYTVNDRWLYAWRNSGTFSTFSVWDATNPKDIHQTASLQLEAKVAVGNGQPTILFYKGYVWFRSSAAMASDRNALYVIDVHNPMNPQLVQEYEKGGTGRYSNFIIEGNYLYEVHVGFGLRIFDVSEPSRPRQIGITRERMIAQDLAASDDFLYMVDDFNFRIVDVSNPQRPRLVMQADLRAYNIAVINDYVYILEGIVDDKTLIYKAWRH